MLQCDFFVTVFMIHLWCILKTFVTLARKYIFSTVWKKAAQKQILCSMDQVIQVWYNMTVTTLKKKRLIEFSKKKFEDKLLQSIYLSYI